MSSRTYHQDYIARIRYANTLPPPPGPPKLLDIPGTGLGDGKYTSAAYASRIAREQPLNIEADAELGMPLDLVGLPGVFDGDEGCIHALDTLPPIHPHDKNLLKAATALGRDTNTANLSFLRRSEVLAASDSAARRNEALARRPVKNGETPRKRPRVEASLDDQSTVIRDIERSFQLANQDTPATNPENRPSSDKIRLWNQPVHPSNPKLKLLDSYPLIPDLEAMPDLGSWMLMKFAKNPVAANKYDSRLDVAVIRPSEPARAIQLQYEDDKRAHEEDPSKPDPGLPRWEYGLYLLNDGTQVQQVKDDFQEDSKPLPDNEDAPTRQPQMYDFQRTFETQVQTSNTEAIFNDSVAIALHDPGIGHRPSMRKAAYVYPISQRISIRASRETKEEDFKPLKAYADEDEPKLKIDGIEVTLRRPNDEEIALRQKGTAAYSTSLEMPEDGSQET